jgi:two-component system sensor histidine kinase KdpD
LEPNSRTHNEEVKIAEKPRPATDLATSEVAAAGLHAGDLPRQIVIAAAIVAIATAISLALRPQFAATNIAMIYLLGVVATALRCNRNISVAACFASVAAFDFFCVPPYFTLVVSHSQYLITLVGMLVVALVISTQTSRVRAQAAAALGREARTETLYRLSGRLADKNQVFELARAAADFAEETFGLSAVIFLPGEGRISFSRRTSDLLLLPRAEEAAAQWVFENGMRAGAGTRQFRDSSGLYVPLKGSRNIEGVLAVVPPQGKSLDQERVHLLELFAGQTALAIERTASQHAADEARFKMQAEEMRSSLLSAVSHDLRTPLASITGAASTLRSQEEKLPIETRHELLDSIADEADRLGRLVANLLDITRLESGVEVRKDNYPLEEIVGSVLRRMERQLRNRPVLTRLPESLPLVHVDDVLIGQLLVNLLENANKYTPEGTPIELAAEADGDAVVLDVLDRGPGFPEGDERRIFEKFYRRGIKGVRGVGLGLPICKAIVEAHRGTIEAFNRPGGGAIFRIRLPLGTQL